MFVDKAMLGMSRYAIAQLKKAVSKKSDALSRYAIALVIVQEERYTLLTHPTI
ncbi:MAG: hypothetical protein F6K55_46685 [Moorea sp. SIO4A3]|nr:hypothetical protein [Moorena sp. SIO4A3]